MRTEKELWQIVLDNQDLFETGLCRWISDVYCKYSISFNEHILLDNALSYNLPPKLYRPYCWFKGDIEPRIEWITNRINEL